MSWLRDPGLAVMDTVDHAFSILSLHTILHYLELFLTFISVCAHIFVIVLHYT